MDTAETILPISKGCLSLATQLRRKKVRDEKGLFIVEGEKCVCEALNHFRCHSFLASRDWFDSHKDFEVSDPECRMFEVTASEMSKLTSFSTPSPVAAIFHKPESDVLPENLEGYEIFLDGIQDPGNLGTIMRTADWFGFRRIFASFDTVDSFNAKTIQASMGAMGRVKVIYCASREFFEMYSGYPVFGLQLDGANIYDANLLSYGVIVMGNEGKGISREVKARVTSPLRIPSYPEGVETSESLNVAAATAITLAEFRRRNR